MRIRLLAVGVLAGGMGLAAGAQSVPTASQALEISVFGAGTGTYTELAEGKNTAITAGIDATLRNYFHVRPSLEIRGTYAIDGGSVAGLKDLMVGVKIQKDYGRFHPYLDALFGRGSVQYQNGGIVIGNFRYERTTTNIFGGGAGVDVGLTRRFDLKADVQFQRWTTPVTDSGTFYPIPVSLGVVYHLDFNRRGHKVKKAKVPANAGNAP